jgi:hypothetical protein
MVKKFCLPSMSVLLSIVLLVHIAVATEKGRNTNSWIPAIVVCQRPVGRNFVKGFKEGGNTTEDIESYGHTYTVRRGLGGWAIRHWGVIWHGFLGQAEINTEIDTPDTFRIKFDGTYGFASRHIGYFKFNTVAEPEVEPFENLRCEVLLDILDLENNPQHRDYVRTRAGGNASLALTYKWQDALDFMNLEAKNNPYRTFFNNCFSVAKKTSMAIGGRQETIDNINKPNFGIGTSKVAMMKVVTTVAELAIFGGIITTIKCVFIAALFRL